MPTPTLTTQEKRHEQGAPGAREHRTAKIVELIGSSRESFEDAIRSALADAAETTRGIRGAHVENLSVKCDAEGKIVEFTANLKIAFGIERTRAP
ncbi:MAG: dodecin family protein [Methanobacteriota archaeon]